MYKQQPKSPMLKALVGKQKNLPRHLQEKILAAPESPTKMKDLSGDGKITKKDVLIGRGVIESPAKLKDACYHKVKAQYDVFPSAYASGAIAKCRKNKGKKKK